MNGIHRVLWSSTAAIALIAGAAAGAAAQTAPSSASEQSAQASAGLQEVIVTAEKREENLQKTPLAVTSLSADLLQQQRVVDPQDLNDVVPDLLAFGNTGSATGATVSIRGIATSDTGHLGTTGIAVHLDGSYRYSGLQPAELYDIERVEVDPGPQGTVYGRAAAAGAINIITNKPRFDEYEASGTVEAGTYGLFRTGGMLNVPIDDTLAVRAAFESEERDGYFSNGYNDADYISGRVQLLWKPSDDLSVRLGGDYQHIGGLGTCLVFTQANTSIVPGNPWNACNATPDSLNSKYWTIFGEINYTLDFGTLTVLPSYHSISEDTIGQELSAGNTLNVIANYHQKEIEARLNSLPDSPIKWVAGVYAFQLDGSLNDVDVFPGFQNLSPYPSIDQESYSIFGQVTYPLTDWLRLTGGARYSYDYASNSGSSFFVGGPFDGKGTGDFTVSTHGYNVSWKASLEADVTDTSMVYFTSGTGYKPGGLNGGAPATEPGEPSTTYGPEKILHFEAGTKNRFFDNRLQLNNAFYYDRYSNYQIGYVSTTNPQPQFDGGIPIYGFISTNLGRADIYGDELSMTYLLTENDRIDFSANYFHGIFRSLLVAAHSSPGGAFSPASNYIGVALPEAPEWSGGIGYQHVFDFADGSVITPRVFTSLSGSYFTQFTNGPGSKQGAYTRTELSVTYDSPDGHWSAEAYVKNLEDSTIKALTQGGSGSLPISQVQYLDPRTAGVMLNAHFSVPRSPTPMTPAPVTEPVQAPPAPSAAPVVELQRQFQVFFDFDKSDITDAAAKVIQAAADAVKAGNVVQLTVTGHTDTVGSAKYNQGLSERRAASVKAALVSDGVSGGEITTVGVGKTGLLVPTADGVREPQNRRAEIVLQ